MRSPLRHLRNGLIEPLEQRTFLSTIFAVDSANTLLRFDSATPASIDQTIPITGLVPGEQVLGIDFRPSTGLLYGLAISNAEGFDAGRLYLISTATGAATALSELPFTGSLADGAAYGFDFNPVTDRIRVVNSREQSFRLHPDTGEALSLNDTPLDVGSLIVAAAYDRNDNDANTPTSLFGIEFSDARHLSRIGTADDPDGLDTGIVTRIGQLGTNFGAVDVGFDIAEDGAAFLSMSAGPSGEYGLFTLDLATGATNSIATVGDGFVPIRGIAVQPSIPPTTSLAVTNTNDSGAGSLRHAIILARQLPGPDVITFNIPGDGPHTIFPGSSLPTLANETSIDGFSQPGSAANSLEIGSNAVLRIQLHGGGQVATGLRLATQSTLRGLAIGGFSIDQIRLDGSNNTVVGCHIGVNAQGEAFLADTFGRGISLVGDTTASTIGGPDPSLRNVISGNFEGIRVNTGPSGVRIQGNYIGTDPSGMVAVPNNQGVVVSGAVNTLIGGENLNEGNVISGNRQDGLVMFLGSDNQIRGNLIGAAADGLTGLGNGEAGLLILGGCAHQIQSNIISGNDGPGIKLDTADTVVPATEMTVTGNGIGVSRAFDRQSFLPGPLGNRGPGIEIAGPSLGTGAVGNKIGSGLAGSNFIAHNGGPGVKITGALSTENPVRGNRIYANDGLEIDLGNPGRDNNDLLDPDAGPNNLQNYPLLASAVATQASGGIRISGNFNSTPSTDFLLDFYVSVVLEPGQPPVQGPFGQAFGVTTDASGNAEFSVFFEQPIPAGAFVSTTATTNADTGNTSELSPGVEVTGDVSLSPPPDAVDDHVTRTIGEHPQINVLANDVDPDDPDAPSLDVEVLTQPANGTAAVFEDNTISYTPNPGFNGSDSFTYQATQIPRLGNDSDTATVFITTASGVGLDVDPDDESGSKQALFILGTPGDDFISIKKKKSQVQILINRVPQGNPLNVPTGSVIIDGGAGNDTISAGSLKLSAGRFFGGEGNDVIKGTKFADLIVGGAGADTINAGTGNDVIISGGGADAVKGAGGDDLFVAGVTDYDSYSSYDSLRDVLFAWTSGADYGSRVSSLTAPDGVGISGARLNADTLADDNELDQLLGAAGRDLFFANEAGGSAIDLLKGRKPDESLLDEG